MIRSLQNRVRKLEDKRKSQGEILGAFIGTVPGEAARKQAEHIKRTGKRPKFSFLINLCGREDEESETA